MDMPAEMIDVNVHPTKLEVRFTDSGRVYSRLLQSLRHQFLTTNLTGRVGPPEPLEERDDLSSPTESQLGLPVDVERQQRQEVIDWARTGQSSSVSSTQSLPSVGVPEFQPFPSGPVADGNLGSTRPGPTATPADVAPWERGETESQENPAVAPSVCYLGFQVHNRYLVTQDESGMVVIDQHALHERVLYERVCAKVLGEGCSLESQKLLVPEPVSLTPAERTAALDAQQTLARIGIEIEEFGGETILIQSYPAMLGKTPPGDMLRTLLESLISAGRQPDAKELLDHLLSTIACKAAVKAGDPLTPEEITSLLEQKDLYHDTHHCPHGRPTALVFSRDELDRMFGRLGPRGNRSHHTPT
jgi:DNA mismatch repair protein MutL